MTNLQIHKRYTIASAVNLEAEFESRGSYTGGPRFNSQMNHFFQMLNFGHVTTGRVRRLLTNERGYGAIAVSSVEVSHELRDVFVNRSGRFQYRVIVSSLADEVFVSFATASAI